MGRSNWITRQFKNAGKTKSRNKTPSAANSRFLKNSGSHRPTLSIRRWIWTSPCHSKSAWTIRIVHQSWAIKEHRKSPNPHQSANRTHTRNRRSASLTPIEIPMAIKTFRNSKPYRIMPKRTTRVKLAIHWERIQCGSHSSTTSANKATKKVARRRKNNLLLRVISLTFPGKSKKTIKSSWRILCWRFRRLTLNFQRMIGKRRALKSRWSTTSRPPRRTGAGCWVRRPSSKVTAISINTKMCRSSKTVEDNQGVMRDSRVMANSDQGSPSSRTIRRL